MNQPIYVNAEVAQNLKGPLLTMKILCIFHVIVTILVGLLTASTIFQGEPNIPVGILTVFLGICSWSFKFVYDGLAKGQKAAWVLAMVWSSLCVPNIFLPLGIYSLNGLLKKNVRAHCLDKEEMPLESTELLVN